jgi:flagellar motor protein MotB
MGIAGFRRVRSGGDANIVAMLSLKLLLLAFFILLSTISQLEERRTQAVMESVSSTFSGRIPALSSAARNDAGIAMQQRQRQLSQRIEQLFRQTLPIVETARSADGRVLRLSVPADRLFRPGSAALLAQRGSLLRRLARELTGARLQAPYAVEVFHGAPRDAETEALRLQVDRAGALVRQLSRYGVPQARLAAGLAPDAAAASVVFAIRLPDAEPKVNAASGEVPPQ